MSADFIQSIPVADIRSSVAGFARPCFAELLQSPATADLYGFAICTVSDAVSVYWTANTRSNLSAKLSQALAAVKGPDGPTAAQLRDWHEFDPPNWPITDQYGQHRSPVSVNCRAVDAAIWHFWTEFKSGPFDEDDLFDLCPLASTRIFHALGNGVSDAIERTDWTAAGGRDKVTVLVWVVAPGENDRQAVREIAARLNPEPLYANFARTYFPLQ
jgi:hypothetical protein